MQCLLCYPSLVCLAPRLLPGSPGAGAWIETADHRILFGVQGQGQAYPEQRSSLIIKNGDDECQRLGTTENNEMRFKGAHLGGYLHFQYNFTLRYAHEMPLASEPHDVRQWMRPHGHLYAGSLRSIKYVSKYLHFCLPSRSVRETEGNELLKMFPLVVYQDE